MTSGEHLVWIWKPAWLYGVSPDFAFAIGVENVHPNLFRNFTILFRVQNYSGASDWEAYSSEIIRPNLVLNPTLNKIFQFQEWQFFVGYSNKEEWIQDYFHHKWQFHHMSIAILKNQTIRELIYDILHRIDRGDSNRAYLDSTENKNRVHAKRLVAMARLRWPAYSQGRPFWANQKLKF